MFNSSIPQMRPAPPPIPVTQECTNNNTTTNTLPTLVTTTNQSTTSNTQTNNSTSVSSNSTKSSIDSDTINSVCSLLHHQDHTHYILSRFCLPVPTSVDPDNPPLCKYGKKGCMVKRSKVYIDGKPVLDLSPTVFIPLPGNLRIYKYNIIDTRTYTCCQPSCSNSKTKSSKIFHHACFMHWMFLKQENDEVKFISMQKENDKILE
jgi:hypothetical protein